MKPKNRLSRAGLFSALASLLLLSGCLKEHLVWAPDGTRAAVIASDGLRFCDADGKLTASLVADVDAVWWFSDSQRLALLKVEEIADWPSAARLLAPERVATIVSAAKEVWKKVESNPPPELPLKDVVDADLIKLYFYNNYKDFSQRHYPEKLGESHSVKRYELVLARAEGDQVVLGRVVQTGLDEIGAVAVSPDGRALAFAVGQSRQKKPDRLLVVPLDADPVLVAEGGFSSSDWTPDGRSLAYARRAAHTGENDGIDLGVISKRRIFDQSGALAVAEKEDELAGLLFSGTTQVKCLRDGRILFNAIELTLPAAPRDAGTTREQLFIADPERPATLVRIVPRETERELPENLATFRLSPDERQIAAADGSAVYVLTVATGELKKVQEADDYGLEAVPVWRATGELTYAKRNARVNDAVPVRKAEIVLKKGDRETVLSRNWPDAILQQVFDAHGNDK
jgi:hypothetical protein